MSQSTFFASVALVAEQTKIPAYVVGGFVRDLVMGRGDRKDIDIVVVGSGIAFAEAFDAEMKQVGSLVLFPDFDTARYVIEDSGEQTILEFAGARSEAYHATSRKPQVVAATLEQDLSRRDFTVNAMAVSVDDLIAFEHGGKEIVPHIIDPFHGQADIEEKILRTPLDPVQTFSDDPLRMLRAIRFAGQLSFGIHSEALQAIFAERERLRIISAERINEELMKMMALPAPSVCLFLLFQTHLLDIILPEVSNLDGVEEIFGHQHKNNLTHTFKVVDNVAERSPKPLLRLAGLLHDIGKPATKKFVPHIGWTFHQHDHVGKKMIFQMSKRLKWAKKDTDYLAKLVRWHLQPISLMDDGITDSAVRRLVVSLGEELDDLLILGESDITTGNPHKKEHRLKNYQHLKTKIIEVTEKDKLRAFQSPLRGEEIMQLAGLRPGPTTGKIKSAIEEAILEGEIPNDHEAARGYFDKIKEEFIKAAAPWERGEVPRG